VIPLNLDGGMARGEVIIVGNPSVMGSSNTDELLYPSLEKRGEGRFYQHYFKIPLYPPLPKGDKDNHN